MLQSGETGGGSLKRTAQSEAELIRNLAKLNMQHSFPHPPYVLKLGNRFPEYFENHMKENEILATLLSFRNKTTDNSTEKK